MRVELMPGESKVDCSASEWVSLIVAPVADVPRICQKTWLSGYLPLVALTNFSVITCVAAGMLAMFPQNESGGAPLALGLRCSLADVDAVVPALSDTATAYADSASPATAAGAK